MELLVYRYVMKTVFSVMASGMKIFISFIILWGEDLNFNHDILLEARVFNGGSVAFDRTRKGKCKTSPDTQCGPGVFCLILFSLIRHVHFCCSIVKVFILLEFAFILKLLSSFLKIFLD